MKVALVHDFLDTYSGAEQVLSQLSILFPDAPIFSLTSKKEIIEKHFPDKTIHTSFLKYLPKFIASNPRLNRKLLLPLLPHAVESLNLADFDLIISSSGAWTKGVITDATAKHICYCHTPARFLWDYTHQFQKEAKVHKGIVGLMVKKILESIRVWDYLSSQRVDYYIANSTEVQKRIQKYFRKDAKVIHPNVDIAPYANQGDKNFALLISRIEKYKNIELVCSYFSKHPEQKVVIAGKGSDLNRLKKKFTQNDNIKFKGYISDSQKVELVNTCSYFIFPANDDFGIAPVEAMAAGKPVLALNQGGAKDTVIPGRTGIFFQNPTLEDFQKAVQALQAHPGFNNKEIMHHAQQFSTQQFQQKCKAYISKIMQKDLFS